jgi:hypothetical protein
MSLVFGLVLSLAPGFRRDVGSFAVNCNPTEAPSPRRPEHRKHILWMEA